MNSEYIEKYGLSLNMDKPVLEESLKVLLTEAHRHAHTFSELADGIGKNVVDESKLNKIRQNTLAEMDEEVRNTHMEAVAGFRDYVIEAVRQDRNAVFLISDLFKEVGEFITNVEEMVTKEVIPNKKSAEREVAIKKAYAEYDEFIALQEMLETFSGMYTTVHGAVDKIDTDDWTEEEDEFQIKTKTLKDGTIKFVTPKLQNPTTRWGNDSNKSENVRMLTPVITKVDDVELHITPTEFSLLYAQPLTGKYHSYKSILDLMDFRSDSGEFKFPKDSKDEDTTLTVAWEKSNI